MTGTKRWDPVEHLRTEEDIAAYLSAAFEEGDAKLAAAALGDIARAKGMSKIARDSGLAREALYRALSEDGNPALDTIMRVSKALGFKFVATPEHATHRDEPGPTTAR